jgi:hypothetical protein
MEILYFWSIVVAFVVVRLAWQIISDIRKRGFHLGECVELLGSFLTIILFFLVFQSIHLLIEDMLPDWDFFHHTDEDGKPEDLRTSISFLTAVPITYLLVLGFKAWRKDRGISTDI